jgi:hypothetical protein
VDAVHEGYELHYGDAQEPSAADRDLALLDGDRRYADGLAALAAIGDLTAISELADAISLCAQAQAEDRPALAGAVWVAAATAIGWGESPDLVGAKQRARAGDGAGADHLRHAADSIRGPSPHG